MTTSISPRLAARRQRYRPAFAKSLPRWPTPRRYFGRRRDALVKQVAWLGGRACTRYAPHRETAHQSEGGEKNAQNQDHPTAAPVKNRAEHARATALTSTGPRTNHP